ncbi:MAG: hypothetical protein J6N54_11350 [Bacteroidales bacterium]|nr:hypothetical protein [Bacteroidales bacterium]
MTGRHFCRTVAAIRTSFHGNARNKGIMPAEKSGLPSGRTKFLRETAIADNPFRLRRHNPH